MVVRKSPKIGDEKLRFGKLERSTSKAYGDFKALKAPLLFSFEQIIKVLEGPCKARCKGELIEVILVQYRVNQLLVADVWIELKPSLLAELGQMSLI